MKILMLYLDRVWYRVGRPSYSEDSSLVGKEYHSGRCIMVLIHVEEGDSERRGRILRKLINNISWISRKTNTRRIILHSFAHLSESKAKPEVAKEIIHEVADRLRSKEYDVHVTPYGYFLELEIRIRPEPIARVFKPL